ncbi:hypothetical protein CASFOL_019457 [Castilleja foliolosa]|uniref:Uncharacterized protein n=1 Tax=Castilleja foliolosa TaxID=1961234 RepID=A0ABD3D531_9LAMI
MSQGLRETLIGELNSPLESVPSVAIGKSEQVPLAPEAPMEQFPLRSELRPDTDLDPPRRRRLRAAESERTLPSFCIFRECHFNLAVNIRPRRVIGGRRRCTATLIINSDSFEVGKLIGIYGFMNVTSYSGLKPGTETELLPEDFSRLRAQNLGEGSVKIRLYEGRVAQGPLEAPLLFLSVYPGQRVGGLEADLMASNELSTHASL